MNCAQVKEQLVDYLYGELAGDARLAFAEHLRACSECSAEVSSHERTLRHTHAALTGPLLQEPPARVRLAVLEAARARAKSAKQPSRAEQPGFFARLWRTPWLLPAFGAASVATVVLLVRVIKNPEVVPGQRRTTIGENTPIVRQPEATPFAAAPPPAPAGAPHPDREVSKSLNTERPREQRAEAGKMSARKGSGSGLKMKAPSQAPGFDSFGSTEGGAGAGRFAEPPPPRGAAKSDKEIDDLSGTFKDREFAAPPAVGPATRARMAAPTPDENRDFGRPPVPIAEKKARAPESTHRPASQPAVTAAAPPVPAPHATRPADKKKVEAAEATWDSAPLEERAKAAPTAGKAGPPLDESAKKADRLFAAQEWAAAATAYRDLLHRYPGHKDTAKWRGRMNQALAADEQARAAKARRTGTAASPFGDGNP